MDRDTLVARWLDLTRRQLPALAASQRWPIRLDHCFMRACLDAAYARPWHEAIPRPAIRHAATEDLARAIAIAEGVLAAPATLPALNAASLRMRAVSATRAAAGAAAPRPAGPARSGTGPARAGRGRG